jgi:hypothetical protein
LKNELTGHELGANKNVFYTLAVTAGATAGVGVRVTGIVTIAAALEAAAAELLCCVFALELDDPAEIMVVVVVVLTVVDPTVHLPFARINPSFCEQVLQATPPSL